MVREVEKHTPLSTSNSWMSPWCGIQLRRVADLLKGLNSAAEGARTFPTEITKTQPSMHAKSKAKRAVHINVTVNDLHCSFNGTTGTSPLTRSRYDPSPQLISVSKC